ncbi:zinc ABC transporter substrate-binding protein [Bifidobacterium callimiconis]|nr:zinc ABC transporter substrate-binding protein [Bifidobacterium callimiconis]
MVASINQWGMLAKEIGGDKVSVTSILGTTNVDAHDFEPQTSDIATISKATVLIVNGAGYDEWATKATTAADTVVNAADTVGASDGDNPHLWFSSDARTAVAKEIADAYGKADPSAKTYFSQRLATWKKSESELEKTMAVFSKEHPNATYAATESVAYYLMSDLKLTDVTPQSYTQAMLNDSEPAPADIQKMQKTLTSKTASLLINNPQEESDMTAMITKAADDAGVPVVDVTEQVPDNATGLIAWMNSLISQFDKALADDQSDESGQADQNGVSDSSSGQSDSSSSDPSNSADSAGE